MFLAIFFYDDDCQRGKNKNYSVAEGVAQNSHCLVGVVKHRNVTLGWFYLSELNLN